MIEAMSAGTPVIAWPHGAVPEVITDGVSGRIVDTIESAVDAIQHASYMDRRKVRGEFERRFTAKRVASDYMDAYRTLLARIRAEAGLAALPALDEISRQIPTEHSEVGVAG